MSSKRRKSKKADAPKPTRFDAFVQHCKNNKWIFPILVLFAILAGIGQFTDTVDKIRKFFSPSSATIPTTVVGNVSNSNSVNIGGNNSGQVTSGNLINQTIVINSNQVGNNYYNCTFNYATQIFQTFITNSITVEALPPDFVILTNQMLLSAERLGKLDFINAFQHANEAIQIIENTNSNFGTHPIDEKVKSVIYLIASMSLDATESNPQLAYNFARKSFELNQDGYTHAIVAITSHNLATSDYYPKKEYARALELDSDAIDIYESNPHLLDSSLPSNSIASWYSNGAWLAANSSQFGKAAIYAAKAYNINPSERQLELLASIYLELGYRVLPMKAKANAFEDFYKFILIRSNDFKNPYMLKTNNQIIQIKGF